MCGANRFTNPEINTALRNLRVQIREGKVNVQHAFAGNFSRVVSAALGNAEFNSENFNPQTVRRFTELFNVPQNGDKWPSQDQTAWALQNFINRRGSVWAHVLPKEAPLTSDDAQFGVGA